MFDRLIGIFSRLINAEYDLPTLFDRIKNVFDSVFKGEASTTKALIDMVVGMIGAFIAYLPIVLLVLCVIEVFFGKKLFGIQKFLFCFVIGYVGGVYFISDIINNFIVVQDYIVGAVIGVICAILCKLVYWLMYVGAFGYLTYLVCFTGAYLAVVTVYTKGIMMYSAIAAVVVIILALIFRKFIEMLGTSALGAYGIVSIVGKNYFDFSSLGFASEEIIKLAVIGVITLIGFIVQVKTRKRY